MVSAFWTNCFLRGLPGLEKLHSREGHFSGVGVRVSCLAWMAGPQIHEWHTPVGRTASDVVYLAWVHGLEKLSYQRETFSTSWPQLPERKSINAVYIRLR